MLVRRRHINLQLLTTFSLSAMSHHDKPDRLAPMNTIYRNKSGLLEQANGRRVETTPVRLLRIQAETLVRCRELQARVASPLVFALSTALKLLCRVSSITRSWSSSQVHRKRAAVLREFDACIGVIRCGGCSWATSRA